MKLIRLTEEAEAEFEEAYAYYFERSEDVAVKFHQYIIKQFQIISQDPMRFPIVYRKVREFVSIKWPYAIYYRDLPHNVEVISVFHGSRDPQIWKSRI